MNYSETIAYLFNSTPVFEQIGAKAYKDDLHNTRILDEHFQHPHRNYKTIHVAGTNGKGSCSHSLAALLQAKGYKVGLYTSPHIKDFRERIRVNSACISEQYVVDFVEKERTFFEPLHPSFFELTTAMALKYFADEHVDIAVIEVGLGGRLDCTNVITPILSIITNISFDHTQFLGNTLASIAAEKAGIIKPHVPVVIGEDVPETRTIFLQKAKEQNAPITFAQDHPEVISSQINEQQQGRDYETVHYQHLHCDLEGDYQEKNMNTVLTAVGVLKSLNIDLTPQLYALQYVAASTHLLGRWMTILHNPTVICDTGHNLAGWQYIAQQLKRQPARNKRIVFGMVDDKDINAVMDLLPQEAQYYWTQARTKRAIPVQQVADLALQKGKRGICFETVEAAYRQALQDAQPDDFIFVGGSSYVVSDLLMAIKIKI